MVPVGGQKEIQKALSLPTMGAFSEQSRESTMPQTLEVESELCLSLIPTDMLNTLLYGSQKERKKRQDTEMFDLYKLAN